MLKKIKIYNRFNMDSFVKGVQEFPFKNKLWHLVSIYGDRERPLLTEHNKKVFYKLGFDTLPRLKHVGF